MTARTHDLAALTLLLFCMTEFTLPNMSVATAIVALGSNIMGATAPDLDEPTAALWQRIPAGSVLGRLFHPLVGGHRMISHSLCGMAIAGCVLWWFLNSIKTVLLVNMPVIWVAFMIGYFSHLVIDTVTREGVPWLFPVPIRFGIPPIRALRMSTGGMIEKGIVFPGLILSSGYIIYLHYSTFVYFILHQLIK